MFIIITCIFLAVAFALIGYLYYSLCRLAALMSELSAHVAHAILKQTLGETSDRFN